MTNDFHELSTAIMRAEDAYHRLRIDGAARDLMALHAPLADSRDFGRWLAQTGFAVGGALAARADAIEAKAAEALGTFANGVVAVVAPVLDGAGFEAHAAAAEMAASAAPGLSSEARRCIARGVYAGLRARAERGAATIH